MDRAFITQAPTHAVRTGSAAPDVAAMDRAFPAQAVALVALTEVPLGLGRQPRRHRRQLFPADELFSAKPVA